MTTDEQTNPKQTNGDPAAESAAIDPASLAAELEAMKNELEKARTQAAEYLDGWQRQRADFVNYKKRVERDQAQTYQNASVTIIKKFLDIIDDLDRALKNRPQEGEGAAWAGGIDLVYRKFSSVLESAGVTPMSAHGQEFDPQMHEAISHEENPDYQSGQIIEMVKQGYMLGERVLRPAQVRVAR